MKKKWHVYILECNDGRFYTGITSDLERRFKEHKRGRGGRFTRSFGIKQMVYQEKCSTRETALKREIEIKRLPRNKKLALMEG